MNSRGERILSPECGWWSLRCLDQAPIKAIAEAAAGQGGDLDAVALEGVDQGLRDAGSSHRAPDGRGARLQPELAGDDAGLPRGMGGAVVAEDLDGLGRVAGPAAALVGLEHHVLDVRPADPGVGHGPPGDDLPAVRVDEEGAADDVAVPSHADSKPSGRRAITRRHRFEPDGGRGQEPRVTTSPS